jgi:hypothetical protein
MLRYTIARHRVGSILQRKASYTTIDRGAVGIIPVQMTVRESSVRRLNFDWTPASMQHSHRRTVKFAEDLVDDDFLRRSQSMQPSVLRWRHRPRSHQEYSGGRAMQTAEQPEGNRRELIDSTASLHVLLTRDKQGGNSATMVSMGMGEDPMLNEYKKTAPRLSQRGSNADAPQGLAPDVCQSFAVNVSNTFVTSLDVRRMS